MRVHSQGSGQILHDNVIQTAVNGSEDARYFGTNRKKTNKEIKNLIAIRSRLVREGGGKDTTHTQHTNTYTHTHTVTHSVSDTEGPERD